MGLLNKLKKMFKAKKAKKGPSKARNIKKKAVAAKKMKKAKRPQKVVKQKGKKAAPEIVGTLVGTVTHFFPQVNAAAVKIEKGNLEMGSELYFKGATTDFKMRITSLQIDRAPVEAASKGAEVGILVKKRVRQGDRVYKI